MKNILIGKNISITDFEILLCMMHSPVTCQKIIDLLGVTDKGAWVSLYRLRKKGFISSRREGKTAVYEIAGKGLSILRDVQDRFQRDDGMTLNQVLSKYFSEKFQEKVKA